MEPLVQGAGGMRMCRAEFINSCIKLCRAHKVLVIFDEVMTGFGRTGALFAKNQCAHSPDIICLSKGLSGGFLPLAVTVATETIYEAFLDESFDKAFAHGHSFTANPIGCAAAIASLNLFADGNLLTHIASLAKVHTEYMTHFANLKLGKNPRVKGTIAALTLPSKQTGYKAEIGKRIKQLAWQKGLILRPLGDTLYLLPPLIITTEELTQAYEIIEKLLTEVLE